MSDENFSMYCQNCGGTLKVSKCVCSNCELTLQGDISLPRLACLSAEDRKFIELFVLSAGSLKEVGKVLNLSYPTVRQQLDRVISNLQNLNVSKQERRMEIIMQLERKEISAEEATKLLNNL